MLTAVSIVNWIAGCVSFRTERKSVAAAKSGTRATNVPLEETIQILAKKAFDGNWFNNTHNLNICEGDLIELLTIATKDQLFQFNGNLYKQIDGVAMGSPLGPLMANTYMCSIEEKLAQGNKLPNFYRRYVDDTFALVPDFAAATDFLHRQTS